MRKNFGAKPYTYPQPVFIIATYGEDGTPDAMNAAWGGISEENRIAMCLSAEHKTVENILARGAFTVSMATEKYVTECDYVGIVSANDVPDKLAKAGFHTVKSDLVDAPIIEELPMALECKLISYDPETCRLEGEIVNVSADESVLDGKGKIDPRKTPPHHFRPRKSRLSRARREGGQCLPRRTETQMTFALSRANDVFTRHIATIKCVLCENATV